jgi:hypothetical protein
VKFSFEDDDLITGCLVISWASFVLIGDNNYIIEEEKD